MIDSVLQCALSVWEGLCAASEFHFFANVVSSLFASLAMLTWKTYFQCDFIANLEPFNIGTDRYDNTGGFVAQ